MKSVLGIYNHFKDDSLYRNSIYLMVSTAIVAGFGFFFWIFVARLFKTENVGIATTLISVSTFLSSFAILGLNVSLVRFLPKSEEKNEMISTSILLVTLASAILATIFLLGVNIFSQELLFLRSNIFYIAIFVGYVIALSVCIIMDSIYVAYRAAENVLFRNTALSILKIGFIFVFVAFGAFGIFSSFVAATVISFIAATGILMYKYNFRPSFAINTKIVKTFGKFSLGNYIAGFIYQAPVLILPIMIIDILYAKVAAYYYIDTMILNLLIVIPTAAAQSFFTESSHNESHTEEHLKKAAGITVSLLLPAVLMVVLFGGFVLHFFGENYRTDALGFLQVISVSSIFMAIILFGNSILRIHHKINTLIILNIVGCAVILGSSYLFIRQGLMGVGWGWTLGQLIVAAIYVGYLTKDRKSYHLL